MRHRTYPPPLTFLQVVGGAALAIALSFLTSCATSPDKISAAYVSPIKYKDHDCDQIALEIDYVSQRVTTLHNTLKKESNADNAQMGIGLVLFWPALFFLEGGDGPAATEYSQLKGEFNALRKASISKKCELNVIPDKLEDLVKPDEEQTEE